MPRGPKGEKRPADVIGNAVHVMRIATGEVEETKPSGRVRSGRAGAKALEQWRFRLRSEAPLPNKPPSSVGVTSKVKRRGDRSRSNHLSLQHHYLGEHAPFRSAAAWCHLGPP